MRPEDLIPPQVEGGKKDFEYERVCGSLDDALKLFEKAADRVIDIDNWHEYGGKATATFKITDNYGLPKHSKANKGLYVKIDIPGPGAAAGYDWVLIEQVKAGKINEHEEYTAIKLRPVGAPDNTDGGITHFFSHKATSTIILKRYYNTIKIHYAGRNEVVNTASESVIENIRNVIVGTAARIGLSNVQWENLMKGLIGIK